MRKIITFLLQTLFCIFNIIAQTNSKVSPALDIFLTFPDVRDFTISSSGNEAYFTIQSPSREIAIIAYIKKTDNTWSEPEIVEFSGDYNDLEAIFSPDEKRLYFASNRPVNDSSEKPKDYDIWYVERETSESKWSKPINIGPPVNTELNEFYPSVASNNNMYFTSDGHGTKGKDDIFYATCDGDQYTTPVSLGDSINTEGYEFNSFIANDESYIIYSGYNRKDGFGGGDLYISFRKNDGSWGKSRNLGSKINSKYMDYCPFVHNVSETLYFTSRRSTVKSNGFTSMNDFIKEITKYENGTSRIYKVPFKEILFQ